MAWDKRGNGRYYTRTRRLNGRRVREYYGKGERAELAAAEDEYRRTLRALTRNAIRRHVNRSAEADAILIRLEEQAQRLTQAGLLAAGFRQHHHGEWRLPRHDPAD
jgi:hypothetical protein